MQKLYKGIIVEESLEDNRVLNGLNFLDVKIINAESPADRWHIFTVSVSIEEIRKLQAHLKMGPWYMHFWNRDTVLAVFAERIFEFSANDKTTWLPAIEYGLTLRIPREQLDFTIT